MTAIVNVKVPEPEFEGQTKTRLGNTNVRTVVDALLSDELWKVLEWHPTVLDAIIEKAIQAQQAATAAKAARDSVRKKSLLTSTILPGKLADCSSSDPRECEIYVVEGDSAAGSAKQVKNAHNDSVLLQERSVHLRAITQIQGRDRQTQAILPLRGKILNTEKASVDRIYQNTELLALLSALGLSKNTTTFDENSLRYHRVVLMTDADVDGSHIRLLLLTFLYRFRKELIDRGHVYIACPPLYKVCGLLGSLQSAVCSLWFGATFHVR